jgi:acylglycerol lipase
VARHPEHARSYPGPTATHGSTVHGTGDKITLERGSEFFHQTGGSTDKTLKLYEGHYHDVLADYGKEEVIADIRA